MLELTNANFDAEVTQSNVPVLIDFWAAWCGPCRGMAPVLEEIETECGESLKVAKVNVDDEAELAARHAVVSIPLFVLYKEGKIIDKIVGAVPKARLVEMIHKTLG